MTYNDNTINNTPTQSPGPADYLNGVLGNLKRDAPSYKEPMTPTSPPQIPTIPPECPNTKPLFCPLANKKQEFNSKCTLQADAFSELLNDYPSPKFPALLINIIKYGAKLGYSGPEHATIKRRNHPSATTNSSVITNEIRKELSMGRLRKLDKLPDKYYCSPLGLVPKKIHSMQTGWRRIFNLSCPDGSSVNDHIPPSFASLKYETFQEVVEAIAHSGKESVMMKRDLKSAFHMIPVCTEDQWLLIFEWEGIYYQDLFLPFGLRTSPFIFNLFGESLKWILQRMYSWTLKRYLDDFLAIFPPGHNTAITSEQFASLCKQVGFTEASEKREDGTCVEYLGLILDTVKMEARLPEDKKARALSGISYILTQEYVTLKQLEQLLGLLEFCISVFPLGRPFLRHVWNLFLRAKSDKQRLTIAARRDLEWWKEFLPIWSGSTIIQVSRRRIHISTDASGKKGIGGAWFEGMHLFSTRMPRRHRTKHINWKELFAILYAFAEWSEQWSNARAIIFCDNTAIVGGINKRTIRGAAIDPLQTLFLLAARGNIEVSAVWVPSEANALADALSRFDKKKIANLVGEQLANSLLRRQNSAIMSKISRLMQHSTSTTVWQNHHEQQ
jgi:hypothetical protein